LSLLVAAAGQGRRLGRGGNKVFLPLGDKVMLAWTLEAAETSALVNEVIVVTGEEDIPRCRQLVSSGPYPKVKQVLPGGRERQDSIAAGLKALSPAAAWVAVHDGARPFLSLALLERVILAAQATGAAIAALPVKETIKKGDGDGRVMATLDRRGLWAVQTPQVFRRQWLEAAYREAAVRGWQVTDDAALVEQAGYPVQLVTGEETNIKITTPGDLILARALMAGAT